MKLKYFSRNHDNATIKVLAKEHLDKLNDIKSTEGSVHSEGSASLAPTIEQARECAALLTYYRMNNKWFLGKVEFE